MKVLYIAHYREFGGWSQAAIDQMLALDIAGVDVVCRNITLTSDRDDLPQKILEFEKKDSSGCDICIQHVLPHHLVGSQAFKKNIAFLEAESLSIKGLTWFPQLEMMDEVWVANKTLQKSLQSDGIKSEVKLVHHATDVDKYKRKYKKFQLTDQEDTFKFYYAGDLNDRKNIGCISSCFHSEFDKSENVSLIYKINRFGLTPDALHQEFDRTLSEVKRDLRIYKNIHDYKKESVITVKIPDEDMCSIHQHCDCFILPSRGEAWSIPAFDAMGFGNTPICSNTGGMADYIQNAGILVEGRWEPVYGMTNTFEDLFTSDEDWYSIDVNQLRKAMRKVFEMYKAGDKEYVSMKSEGIKRAKEYSHENIGKLIKDILND